MGDPRDTPLDPDVIAPRRVDRPRINARRIALPSDETTVHRGIPVTTPARTLVDLAEVLDQDELRATFETARRRGLLDMEAVRASRARVEWRPSLAMLDEVIAKFSRD